MRRIKSQILGAVEENPRTGSRKGQKPHPCKRRKSAAPGGREFLRKSEKLPMMLSAADDDGAAVEVMQWLYELSGNAGSKFVHYTSGGHGTEMFAAHKELPGTIVDWYVQTLVKTPGNAPAVSGTS